MSQKHKVLIVGARGYSGLELARILLKHPHAELVACFATDTKWKLSDYLPETAAEKIQVLDLNQLEKTAAKVHTVFFATPVETSMELAPACLKAGANVIDLSGAFRLDKETFNSAYKVEHKAAALIDQAVYGLSPFAKPAIKKPALISNPGCYATSVQMALVPLLKSGTLVESSIVVDAKSGTSGAGRKAAEGMLFTEVDGECLPYKIASHQHYPEIVAHLNAFTGKTVSPFFTTHLLSVRRGIISSIYARINDTWMNKPLEMLEKQIQDSFQECFANYPLVKITKLDSKNETSALQLKKVVGSARTHIAWKLDGNKLYVFSLIDNLLKGAASQAIENWNRIVDCPIQTALIDLEGAL